MSVGLQQLLVGVLVIACALFSGWRLMTVRLRLRTLALLGMLPGVGRAAWLARLRERTLAQQLSACGGCSQASGPPPARPGGASRNQTPGELRR
jgi:hypothetical protein